MNKSIHLLNPLDKPFGSLSNNYRMLMEIDGKKWSTVSNYIYSNSALNPLYANLLQNMDTKKISEEFAKSVNATIEFTSFTALQNALHERINKDIDFRDSLFATGDAPLVYDSDNKILGIRNNKGANLAGKVMEQLRNQHNIKFREESFSQTEKDLVQKIQHNYHAYMLLQDLIQQGKSSLEEFLGTNAEAVLTKLKFDRTKMLPLELVFKMYRRRQIPDAVMSSLVNFDVMVHQLRKENLRSCGLKQREIVADVIFDTYLREMLRREYPSFSNEQLNDAMMTINVTTTTKELNEMKEKIASLFNQVFDVSPFSEAMTAKINQSLDEYKFIIPRESELEKVEAFVLPPFVHTQQPELMSLVTDYSKPPFVILSTPNNPLSVEFSNSAVIIEGRVFPSVAHYMYAMLLSTLSSVKTIANAHKLLVVDENVSMHDLSNYISLTQTKNLFFKELSTSIHSDLEKYMKIALDKKFENSKMQEILLSTENATLVWSDAQDLFLGMVKGKGENVVGNYLVKLREKLQKTHQKDFDEQVQLTDILDIMKTDSFIGDWIKLRVKELMMNSYNIALCCKTTITAAFMQNVVQFLYNHCGKLEQQTGLETVIPVPEYFADMVRAFTVQRKVDSEEGEKLVYRSIMLRVTNDVIEIVWAYILNLVFTLYTFAEEKSLQGLRVVVAQAEMYLSEVQQCKGKLSSNTNKCIFSALVNVLAMIKQIAESVSANVHVNQRSIETAINIILNKNLETESTKGEEISVESLEVLKKVKKAKTETVQETVKAKPTPKAKRGRKKLAEKISIPPTGKEEDSDTEGELVFEDSEEEEDDSEKMEEEIFDEDVEDIDEQDYEAEIEKGDWGEGEREEDMDIASAVIDYHILQELKVIDSQIENEANVVMLAKQAIKQIAQYKMPIKIKTNRVNFFATLVQ